MTKNTNALTIALFLFSVIFAETAFSYESSSDKKECKKPKIRTFIPADKSEVPPGSEISFHVTNNIDPTKIEVTVKKIPVEVTLEDRNLFYIVRGKLPDSLKNTYARISIKAVALLGCKTKGGWLLKITDGPASEGGGDAGDKTEGEKLESVEGEVGAVNTDEKKSGAQKEDKPATGQN